MGAMTGFYQRGNGSQGFGNVALLPPERQKIVVRGLDARTFYGVAIKWNNHSAAFSLTACDKAGRSLERTESFYLNKIKALFYVKSFVGNPMPFTVKSPPANFPNHALALVFKDGEVIVGHPPQFHNNHAPYFLLAPEEENANNLLVLADRSSIAAVHDAEDYYEQQQETFKTFLQEHFLPGMTMEECVGAYYFGKQDYNNALRHFRIAHERAPYSDAIQKKLCATEYNLGVRHIKQKDYETALFFMDSVLKMDPSHQEARAKKGQLLERLRMRDSHCDIQETPPVSLAREQEALLTSLDWFHKRHDCILFGPRQSGKTGAAMSLGHKLHKRGHSVYYHRVFKLLEHMDKAKLEGKLPKLLEDLWDVELLILDDWTSEGISEEQCRNLLIILSERHQRRATIIVSELEPDRWRRHFGQQPESYAIVQRVVENAHKIMFHPLEKTHSREKAHLS